MKKLVLSIMLLAATKAAYAQGGCSSVIRIPPMAPGISFQEMFFCPTGGGCNDMVLITYYEAGGYAVYSCNSCTQCPF